MSAQATGRSDAPARGDGVRALFNPTSIALVGATDKSGWSLSTYHNLHEHGFTGPVHLVNPRTETVHGQRTHRSLSDIGEPVDLAYVMVPTAAVLPVLREGADLGIRNYVVLTSGFGETGGQGRAAEEAVVAFARERGLTVLGPNGNGFINATAASTPYGLPIAHTPTPGAVGIVLQSGALASSVLAFAEARGVGISLLTSMGNESMMSVTDVVDHLVDDPATRVIALFLESVRHPAEFARVARRALDAGKPIVALKIGRSSRASHTAVAHTGALVGDDAVVDAAFRQLGVVRVRSLEDLITTAGLLAATGPLPGNRIGVVTPSGGASEIIADRAEDEGLELPDYAPDTVRRLTGLLPEFATTGNPLDVTGYVVVDRTLLGRALDVVIDDPGIDVVMLLSEPPRVAPPDPDAAMRVYEATARRIADAVRPVVVVSNVLLDLGPFAREVQLRTGYPYVAGGIEHGMQAIGAAVRWSRTYRRHLAQRGVPRARASDDLPLVVPAGERQGTWAEHRAARLLSEAGVPVVPTEPAADADTAVAAAQRLGYPVVLKIAAEGLGHKSDIGGVRLGLTGPEEVRTAFTEVVGAVDVPGASALVQPQRSGGVELLVGVVRDPTWGLTLAVGLGGVWVEVLKDSALRLLPVDTAEIRTALQELRGVAALRGARGATPADLDAIAAVIARIAACAETLGEDLESLEVNPLLVTGSHVEALDALITWRA